MMVNANVINSLVAVVFVALLVISYFVVFLLNKNTPLPEGCEHLKRDSEKCHNCKNAGCFVKIQESENTDISRENT